jgi:outer membrane lipoprotein LolB
VISLINRKCYFGVLFLVTLLISGCSVFQLAQEAPDADWAFKGKMAIRNATEASSFNVNWLQQGEYFQIILTGPLGQGEVSIKGDPTSVTLVQGGRTLTSNSLNNLVYEVTEMDLPLDHLQYWVRAKGSPFAAFESSLDEQNLVSSISQEGWEVSITSYFDQPIQDPRKISFSNGKDNGKLVIREWIKSDQQTPN